MWKRLPLLLALLAPSCAIDNTPEEYIQTIQANYLHVPEPIIVTLWEEWPALDGEDVRWVRSTIHYNKAHRNWIVNLNWTWWEGATHSERVMTLSHELCHTVYDHDVLIPDLWYALEPGEWEFRQKRARHCAGDILRRMAQ